MNEKAKPITYPVQLHEHIDVPELIAHKMLREATDLIRADAPRMSINDAEVEAAERIIDWYDDVSWDLEIIDQVGLASYISGRTTPKILATLYGLKAKGHTEVKL